MLVIFTLPWNIILDFFPELGITSIKSIPYEISILAKGFLSTKKITLDYQAGYADAIYLTKCLFYLMCVFVIFLSIWLLSGDQVLIEVSEFNPVVNFILLVIGWIAISLVISLAMFPLFYSLINAYSNDFLNIGFWEYEIKNGFISLRVSAFILTINFITFFYGTLKSSVISLNYKKYADSSVDKASSFTLQNIFYLFSLYLIIESRVSGLTGLYLTVSSWLLLLIIDDWKVISEYSIGLSKKIIKRHKTKIWVLIQQSNTRCRILNARMRKIINHSLRECLYLPQVT